MHVLENEDRRLRRLQLVQELGGDRVWARLPGDELRQAPADLLGHVQQRPERARREERVAGSVEDPGRALLRAELADERRLPDARLAAHDH